MKKETTMAPSPVKVCMHVLGKARTDVRVMRAATALVEAGFVVTVVDIESERSHLVEEDMRGVRVKHVIAPNWYTSRRCKPWFLVNVVLLLIRSTLRVLLTPAEVYHAHDLTALPACYITARLRRKHLIFDAHELPLPDEKYSTRWRGLAGLSKFLLAGMMPYCAGVITVSPPIAHEIRKHYCCPEVTLIRNVPPYREVPKNDRLRQQLGLSPAIRIALYQGNMQPDRQLDKLIRAASYLERDIVIVIMGRSIGAAQSQLEALIAVEGVADRVKILPPVPYTELLDWTGSADIGLIVYAPDYSLNTRMSLPNKIFEYLMAGLPVLASPLDSVVEIISTYEVGQVVSSLTPTDVGAAINAILADRVALDHMRRNALDATRQHLCWEKESSQLVRLYREIDSGH